MAIDATRALVADGRPMSYSCLPAVPSRGTNEERIGPIQSTSLSTASPRFHIADVRSDRKSAHSRRPGGLHPLFLRCRISPRCCRNRRSAWHRGGVPATIDGVDVNRARAISRGRPRRPCARWWKLLRLGLGRIVRGIVDGGPDAGALWGVTSHPLAQVARPQADQGRSAPDERCSCLRGRPARGCQGPKRYMPSLRCHFAAVACAKLETRVGRPSPHVKPWSEASISTAPDAASARYRPAAHRLAEVPQRHAL